MRIGPAFFIIAVWFAWVGPVNAIEVAPRITDREIIEALAGIRADIKRLEEGQRALQKQLDDMRAGLQKQIDDARAGLQKQIDDVKDFMLWGFGVTFAGIFGLIGFVLWDRRTALAPAVARTRDLEDREERLERAMKELAEKDPRIAEVLRHVGLL